ncbi:hypothetical protein JOB18_010003 [Solea senegalensis]|uniref:Schwannomin interacting protein 1 C-terminal domain-containing protein n=1 Tax=Solea senegalensis TaxID=28829 RepID=A0AAV6PZP7_SOLSE|nr:hypothetical protein JOB18_010003 [Solea senegalensis]
MTSFALQKQISPSKHLIVWNLEASGLNEELVQLLLIRDELHMEQDAMLVDIEDLTRHAESQQKHLAERTLSK